MIVVQWIFLTTYVTNVNAAKYFKLPQVKNIINSVLNKAAGCSAPFVDNGIPFMGNKLFRRIYGIRAFYTWKCREDCHMPTIKKIRCPKSSISGVGDRPDQITASCVCIGRLKKRKNQCSTNYHHQTSRFNITRVWPRKCWTRSYTWSQIEAAHHQFCPAAYSTTKESSVATTKKPLPPTPPKPPPTPTTTTAKATTVTAVKMTTTGKTLTTRALITTSILITTTTQSTTTYTSRGTRNTSEVLRLKDPSISNKISAVIAGTTSTSKSTQYNKPMTTTEKFFASVITSSRRMDMNSHPVDNSTTVRLNNPGSMLTKFEGQAKSVATEHFNHTDASRTSLAPLPTNLLWSILTGSLRHTELPSSVFITLGSNRNTRHRSSAQPVNGSTSSKRENTTMISKNIVILLSSNALDNAASITREGITPLSSTPLIASRNQSLKESHHSSTDTFTEPHNRLLSITSSQQSQRTVTYRNMQESMGRSTVDTGDQTKTAFLKQIIRENLNNESQVLGSTYRIDAVTTPTSSATSHHQTKNTSETFYLNKVPVAQMLNNSQQSGIKNPRIVPYDTGAFGILTSNRSLLSAEKMSKTPYNTDNRNVLNSKTQPYIKTVMNSYPTTAEKKLTWTTELANNMQANYTATTTPWRPRSIGLHTLISYSNVRQQPIFASIGITEKLLARDHKLTTINPVQLSSWTPRITSSRSGTSPMTFAKYIRTQKAIRLTNSELTKTTLNSGINIHIANSLQTLGENFMVSFASPVASSKNSFRTNQPSSTVGNNLTISTLIPSRSTSTGLPSDVTSILAAGQVVYSSSKQTTDLNSVDKKSSARSANKSASLVVITTSYRPSFLSTNSPLRSSLFNAARHGSSLRTWDAASKLHSTISTDTSKKLQITSTGVPNTSGKLSPRLKNSSAITSATRRLTDNLPTGEHPFTAQTVGTSQRSVTDRIKKFISKSVIVWFPGESQEMTSKIETFSSTRQILETTVNSSGIPSFVSTLQQSDNQRARSSYGEIATTFAGENKSSIMKTVIQLQPSTRAPFNTIIQGTSLKSTAVEWLSNSSGSMDSSFNISTDRMHDMVSSYHKHSVPTPKHVETYMDNLTTRSELPTQLHVERDIQSAVKNTEKVTNISYTTNIYLVKGQLQSEQITKVRDYSKHKSTRLPNSGPSLATMIEQLSTRSAKSSEEGLRTNTLTSQINTSNPPNTDVSKGPITNEMKMGTTAIQGRLKSNSTTNTIQYQLSLNNKDMASNYNNFYTFNALQQKLSFTGWYGRTNLISTKSIFGITEIVATSKPETIRTSYHNFALKDRSEHTTKGEDHNSREILQILNGESTTLASHNPTQLKSDFEKWSSNLAKTQQLSESAKSINSQQRNETWSSIFPPKHIPAYISQFNNSTVDDFNATRTKILNENHVTQKLSSPFNIFTSTHIYSQLFPLDTIESMMTKITTYQPFWTESHKSSPVLDHRGTMLSSSHEIRNTLPINTFTSDKQDGKSSMAVSSSMNSSISTMNRSRSEHISTKSALEQIINISVETETASSTWISRQNALFTTRKNATKDIDKKSMTMSSVGSYQLDSQNMVTSLAITSKKVNLADELVNRSFATLRIENKTSKDFRSGSNKSVGQIPALPGSNHSTSGSMRKDSLLSQLLTTSMLTENFNSLASRTQNFMHEVSSDSLVVSELKSTSVSERFKPNTTMPSSVTESFHDTTVSGRTSTSSFVTEITQNSRDIQSKAILPTSGNNAPTKQSTSSDSSPLRKSAIQRAPLTAIPVEASTDSGFPNDRKIVSPSPSTQYGILSTNSATSRTNEQKTSAILKGATKLVDSQASEGIKVLVDRASITSTLSISQMQSIDYPVSTSIAPGWISVTVRPAFKVNTFGMMSAIELTSDSATASQSYTAMATSNLYQLSTKVANATSVQHGNIPSTIVIPATEYSRNILVFATPKVNQNMTNTLLNSPKELTLTSIWTQSNAHISSSSTMERVGSFGFTKEKTDHIPFSSSTHMDMDVTSPEPQTSQPVLSTTFMHDTGTKTEKIGDRTQNSIVRSTSSSAPNLPTHKSQWFSDPRVDMTFGFTVFSSQNSSHQRGTHSPTVTSVNPLTSTVEKFSNHRYSLYTTKSAFYSMFKSEYQSISPVRSDSDQMMAIQVTKRPPSKPLISNTQDNSINQTKFLSTQGLEMTTQYVSEKFDTLSSSQETTFDTTFENATGNQTDHSRFATISGSINARQENSTKLQPRSAYSTVVLTSNMKNIQKISRSIVHQETIQSATSPKMHSIPSLINSKPTGIFSSTRLAVTKPIGRSKTTLDSYSVEWNVHSGSMSTLGSQSQQLLNTKTSHHLSEEADSKTESGTMPSSAGIFESTSSNAMISGKSKGNFLSPESSTIGQMSIEFTDVTSGKIQWTATNTVTPIIVNTAASHSSILNIITGDESRMKYTDNQGLTQTIKSPLKTSLGDIISKYSIMNFSVSQVQSTLSSTKSAPDISKRFSNSHSELGTTGIEKFRGSIDNNKQTRSVSIAGNESSTPYLYKLNTTMADVITTNEVKFDRFSRHQLPTTSATRAEPRGVVMQARIGSTLKHIQR